MVGVLERPAGTNFHTERCLVLHYLRFSLDLFSFAIKFVWPIQEQDVTCPKANNGPANGSGNVDAAEIRVATAMNLELMTAPNESTKAFRERGMAPLGHQECIRFPKPRFKYAPHRDAFVQ